jgi:hypothetical protein
MRAQYLQAGCDVLLPGNFDKLLATNFTHFFPKYFSSINDTKPTLELRNSMDYDSS